MLQADAKIRYIDLLKEVAGTMTFSDDVQEFIKLLDLPEANEEPIKVVLSKQNSNGTCKLNDDSNFVTSNGITNSTN